MKKGKVLKVAKLKVPKVKSRNNFIYQQIYPLWFRTQGCKSNQFTGFREPRFTLQKPFMINE